MSARVLSILIAIALCACLLYGCGSPSPGADHVSFDTLFERVATYNDCQVYRQVDTNVLYVYSGSGFTVMFNADGTPMVWSGR